MGRRGFLEFIGGIGVGVILGYYTGAKRLLGIQDSSEHPTASQPDTTSPDDSQQPSGRRFSFEQTDAGSGQLPSPWSVISDPTSDGFNSVEISDQHSTHGSQTLHMSGNGRLDRILVGFVGDLSDIETVRCDIFIERANVGVGEIYFGKWNGESTKILPFLGSTGGEGQSRFSSTGQFTDIEGDLSEMSGEHELLFNVRGDNEAYFDNLRFLDSDGNLVSPLD